MRLEGFKSINSKKKEVLNYKGLLNNLSEISISKVQRKERSQAVMSRGSCKSKKKRANLYSN